MTFDTDTITAAAQRIGISTEDLNAVIQSGSSVTYQAGDYLFHESTPRLWLGIVQEGQVEIMRGTHARQVDLVTLSSGAVISEGVVLDESPHATSAVTRQGATVWQIPRAALEKVRAEKPEVFCRLAGRIAARLSERLNHAAGRIAGEKVETLISSVRNEHDSLGEREVPNHAYYGVQTLRGVENFPLSGIRLYHFEHFIRAFAYVKKAAALANCELGVLDSMKAQAIVKACDEIAAGKLHDQFVIDMFQGGAGTSTNMNANEVIANRALEILGHRKGDYQHLHPNDHVNCSQSTNDAYPTAIKLGVILTLRDTLSAWRELRVALDAKASEFADVLKMGRTENQDAVPMTLGQEFSAYAVMIGEGIRHLTRAGEEFLAINMGATAIGTGLNSPVGYASLCTQRLAEASGIPVTLADNLVEATQDSGEFSLMSGTMKTAAVQLSKICNDLRWMSSGPRCGLYEIRLPSMQPGSSIMPGKVNPVVPEAVSQICFQIIGADVTVSMAAEASELELNMAEPVIAFNLFFGLTLLRNAAIILNSRCIAGIEANRERCLEYVRNSIGLVTALNPVLGYEKSAAIAKEALKTGGSVYDLVLQKGWLTKERLDDLLRPENMTHPRKLS
ncbi:cyclic nucleotide-binding protein [Chthoniobacter flavus Ellin428]|uniref:Cyclic nucleotide-binding protein n=1 Tax=Chthoniobacter flavus Ellin428 TaxID=497964 RepID=B4CX45_9BACT|nr:aspartate ammonia-lyase [Chthoniobacter flavus]EDY20843.1 cyclic nucleotide-binding protein [Chthoniobacter flavus Ellin428]TCO85665.1 aspartate ammonia-lyase [Chthoniobacter flavus]